ncbi:MAG: alkaline phosphatase family protein, partial [Actinobacteria bacterium]|nr:alkaline phosphatase family protein [Actinomycetota bacterium]
PKILTRIWRGFDPVHSADITIVPKEPNFSGSFTHVTHTGPWDYLQKIPLVFYGPERIADAGIVREAVNIIDVYATVGEVLDADIPPRPATVLDDALAEGKKGAPKLVVVVVWDGVGRNVLKLWPDRWPNLAKLERTGTSYFNASVGSSPSVTPATHSSLATGAFPRDHKVVSIEYRGDDGKMHNAFERSDPSQLALTTFADEIDKFYGNEPKMGLVGWSVGGNPATGPGAWITNHLGMLGHGNAMPGGDKDEVALIGDTGNITANPEIYSFPPYLDDFGGLEQHAAELDRADGEADGMWLGHDVLEGHDSPAWVEFQTDILTTMVRESGYGADDVPDILLTNFKVTDIAAHNFTINSPELAAVLEAQDAALGELVSFLDEEVGDYVVVVTADHGHTPDPATTGAWPIHPQELVADLDARFDVPKARSLVEATEPVGLYIDRDVARSRGVDLDEIVTFLNRYTIRENADREGLPDGYQGRGSERVHSAAFAKHHLPDIMTCAFGSTSPPEDLDA